MTAPAHSFADLLQSAVNDPGIISSAYHSFHNYSLGNQLLAWAQCIERGITPGPIATFMGWKEKGRHVTKGAKAITLCMPVTVKKKGEQEDDEQAACFTRFIYKPHWFVLAQTEGQPLASMPIPTWDRGKALEVLNVTEVPFEGTNGNTIGFARQRSIASRH
jgi:hypothetical protein